MSDTPTPTPSTERSERIWITVSGWAAVLLLIFGLHVAVVKGSIDQIARFSLILGAGCSLNWLWGHGPSLLQKFRNWVRGGGLNSAVAVTAVLVVIIVGNSIARRRLPLKWDLTKNQRFTLAPRTREIVKALKSPVKATVYIPAGRSSSRVKDLFRQYADASDRFSWTQVDPLTNLNQVLSKNVKLTQDLQGGFLEQDGKRQDLTEFSEKAVTGAILKLSRSTIRKVYFLEGHGEMAIDSAGDVRNSVAALVRDLRDVQWVVEKLNLYGNKAPTLDVAEAACVVIAGPKLPLASEERKRLKEYLDKGGRVLLFLNAGTPSQQEFLKDWGIQVGDDIILDRAQSQGLVVVDRPEDHPSTRQISRLIFAPMRSVRPATTPPTGVTHTTLVKTGEFTEVFPGFKPGKPINEGGGKQESAPVAVLAEKSIGTGTDTPKARVLVVGDATFATDMMANFPVSNLAMASGLVSYLGEEEALVSIPPKDENTEQAFLTPSQQQFVQLLHFADFPLLALALAILVYLKRR